MATRVVLIVIGIVSRALILPFTKHANVWLHTHQELLDMWIAWDGNWYLRVAGQWYPKGILSYGQTNYAFFPLYPFLIKVIGYILHSNVVAALFVANLSLIISGVLLYKLVLLDGDETVALRTIKYLFIFPSSFIFSGVLAESLYLMLLLVCFYYTRRQRLFRAGIAGFFLSLTKPYGILITLPMLYEYMLARNFNLGKIKLNIINMLLPVLGTLVFHLFCYCQTGDWLAYEHTKVSGWYHRLNNPLYTIAYALFKKPHNINVFFPACYFLILLSFLLVYARRLRVSYLLYSLLAIGIILSSASYGIFVGIARYLSTFFVFFILFAKIANSERRDQALTLIFALLQGFLTVFWVSGFLMLM